MLTAYLLTKLYSLQLVSAITTFYFEKVTLPARTVVRILFFFSSSVFTLKGFYLTPHSL